MNKNRKRVGALLLALMMMFTMLPTGASAAGSQGNIFGDFIRDLTGFPNHGI